jgi:hypothetical protein
MNRPPDRQWLMLLLAAVFLCAVVRPAPAAVDPHQIDDSLLKAREYLYRYQKNGTWEKTPEPDPTKDRTDPENGQFGGTTALCVYALLASGESPQSEKLKPAVEFLINAHMTGVYAVSVRAVVWTLLPQTDEVKALTNRDMQFLQRALITSGNGRGFYDYTELDRDNNRIDHSVSQFAVLGAWACAERLDPPPLTYWRLVDTAWRSTQHATGSWSYSKTPTNRDPATVAMTAAGVATLFITQDFLNRGRSFEPAGNLHDPGIEKGIKWISEHYDTLINGKSEGQNNPYYGLFGVERIGLASGYRFFGDVNWYDDGASFLIKTQNRQGGWSGAINTALAMLFLARGRCPVAMNKLSYDIITTGNRVAEANWNQRPRDAANLTKFISRQTERALNWQIIDFKAPVEDWLDAPILYMSGNQPLNLSDEQKAKLKQFVLSGGLVVGHADGGATAFANTFKKLAGELFSYEFRPLPASHPILADEQFQASKWRRKLSVLGMSNGVRELFLLLPDSDPARSWQSYDTAARPEAFELLANIFQYAVDKQNLRLKGDRFTVARDTAIKPQKTLSIARVKYAGNWDPEPGGWQRLAALFNNQQQMELTTETVEIDALASAKPRIAHLTGTDAIKLDGKAAAALKTFIENGGLIIIDAAGGSSAFGQSIEQVLQSNFPDDAASLSEPLPADHPIYTRAGTKLEIAYRPFAQRTLTGDMKAGRIRGMTHKGHLAILYSPEDLSVGLVGQPVDAIRGYTPATATQLMTNILLLAETQSEKPQE